MTRYFMLMLMVSASVYCAEPKHVVDDAEVIRYAKGLNTSKLDRTLPPSRLEDWLSAGSPHLDKVEWQKGDCDIKPGVPEPKNGWPLCVRARLQKGEVKGWIDLTIGTTRSGISGKPRFAYGVVISKAVDVREHFRKVQRLSELPRIIKEVEEADSRIQK